MLTAMVRLMLCAFRRNLIHSLLSWSWWCVVASALRAGGVFWLNQFFVDIPVLRSAEINDQNVLLSAKVFQMHFAVSPYCVVLTGPNSESMMAR